MPIKLHWNDFPQLIPATHESIQPGLAGPVTGVVSDYLIVAGGSNFPDAMPWRGGTKTYYNQIYFINTNDSASGWKVSESVLKEPLAYPACVTLNNEIYCVGGENLDGPTSHVVKILNNGDNFNLREQTKFPLSVSNAGITSIDRTIYVVGGIGENGALSDFYCANSGSDSLIWEKLPDLPVALSHAVVASQYDRSEQCVYVMGGRNRTGDLTEFFSKVWKYSPSKKQWKNCGDIAVKENQPYALAAGTGVAIGENSIILLGGDHGILFNKTEDFITRILAEPDEIKKSKLIEQKNAHLENHPGFDRLVLIYNTLTNKCQQVGTLPHAAQVTTTAVRKSNKIYIPNGEIKPGVRTPKVNSLDVSDINKQ